MAASWLEGIGARDLAPMVWEIDINGYGPADVGAYAALKKYVGDRTGLDAHHIVGVEHLKLVETPYTVETAPAVSIPKCLHNRVISPRITAEQNYLGGRPRGGKFEVTRAEIVMLYREVYEWHTAFKELFVIAENVLRLR